MVIPCLKDCLNPYEILFVPWSAFLLCTTLFKGFKPPKVKPLVFFANTIPF